MGEGPKLTLERGGEVFGSEGTRDGAASASSGGDSPVAGLGGSPRERLDGII